MDSYNFQFYTRKLKHQEHHQTRPNIFSSHMCLVGTAGGDQRAGGGEWEAGKTREETDAPAGLGLLTRKGL